MVFEEVLVHRPSDVLLGTGVQQTRGQQLSFQLAILPGHRFFAAFSTAARMAASAAHGDVEVLGKPHDGGWVLAVVGPGLVEDHVVGDVEQLRLAEGQRGDESVAAVPAFASRCWAG